MGHKVFVSYKYQDDDVRMIPGVIQPTWPCDYVDYIQNKVLSPTDVYKGEKSDEDISSWGEYRIWEHLKNKIYDSSVTITLDVFTHKSVKNKGDKKQYFIEGHHEAIIDKDDWLLVQKLIRERHYCKNRRRRRPRIMVKGCLAGFALIDLGWDDDDIESIFTTSKTTTQEACTSENIEIIEIKGE